MYATGDAEHWRRKYFDALKSLESEERGFRAVEAVLRRLLARLCSAAVGRSSGLDLELKRLVTALRTGENAAGLEALMSPLTDAVAALGRESGRHNTVVVPTASPDPAADRIQDVLARLLDLVAQNETFGEQVAEIRGQLAESLQAGQLPVVLSDIVDLLSRRVSAVEVEKREIEGLLAQVTGRLDELSHFMGVENADREAALEGTREFNTRIFANVSELGAHVADEPDLGQVKQRVQVGLDIISAQVQEFRDREETRVRLAVERSEKMRARVESLELETRNLHDRLRDEQRLAMVDALTQIPNRMSYDQRLKEEFSRWQRSGQPVCLLAWDIDHFKRVNDVYGHRAGDKVLRVVAESLASRLRQTDFIARYGGEEFVMILAGTMVAEALQVADELRTAVAGLGFHFRGAPVSVTASCGVSEFREGDRIDDAFERADAALYRAKSAGRNRCITA